MSPDPGNYVSDDKQVNQPSDTRGTWNLTGTTSIRPWLRFRNRWDFRSFKPTAGSKGGIRMMGSHVKSPNDKRQSATIKRLTVANQGRIDES
ncbi:hypothetical protein Psuf_066310 [Phytohabitans suffuscus]|uniref:Uncharacterized protein n=1 Tax=Phytohabitans suffuscus TaxID=624315 RepID=A0A6F8YTQ1_9ACTN|nr:hypothetical protein Psuf_066310 [Phytohabitans suffuscus]